MKKLIIIVLLCAALLVFIVHENTHLVLTEYTFTSDTLPQSFDGFRILQVSDMHDALIGEDNSDIALLARKAAPDIIVITGDLVDAMRTDIDRSVSAVKRLCAICPVYYANGNHEGALAQSDYRRLRNGLSEAGVILLEDRAVYIERGADAIQLAGLSDRNFIDENDYGAVLDRMTGTVRFITDEDRFTVLLSHRPEFTDIYSASSAQLILTGHTHGGQVRLPFIGGLYAPGEGFLPEHDGGVYDIGGKTMIVSRGIGNSSFPLRVFNNPELVLVTLKAKNR